jgi:hypothetical protein
MLMYKKEGGGEKKEHGTHMRTQRGYHASAAMRRGYYARLRDVCLVTTRNFYLGVSLGGCNVVHTLCSLMS